MDLGIEDGLEIIETAYKKTAEEKLWEMWLVDYSRMTSETFINFSNYLKKATVNEHKNNEESKEISVEEIIAQAERIKKIDQGRR